MGGGVKSGGWRRLGGWFLGVCESGAVSVARVCAGLLGVLVAVDVALSVGTGGGDDDRWYSDERYWAVGIGSGRGGAAREPMRSGMVSERGQLV
jgi:hypothetical protein